MLSDALELPFPERVAWDHVVVRFPEARVIQDPTSLLNYLRAIPETQVAAMRAALPAALSRQHFSKKP